MSQAGSLNNGGGVVPGDVATDYVTDSGTAVPAFNIINIIGGPGIATSGSGDTVVISALSAGFVWNSVTSVSPVNPIQLVKQNGYICNGSSMVTFLLPLAPTIGDSFIVLSATARFQVTQNGSQAVTIGPISTTSGATGTTTSNTLGDKVEFTYIGVYGGVATFIASPPQGTLTLF